MRVLWLSALLLMGCAHGVGNEELLDGEERSQAATDQLAQGLLRLDWRSAGGELDQARDESLSQGKRLNAYTRALTVLAAMSDRYALEQRKHPDLAYSTRADQLMVAERRCSDQLAKVSRERADFVRAMGDGDSDVAPPDPPPAPSKRKISPAKFAAHKQGGKKSHVAKIHKAKRHYVVANAG
ncbi:MAG: hypothetical protein QM723_18300 [Myxococcaceae bacterium]